MLTVADIMTTNVWLIASSATVAEAIEQMQRRQVRSLLVERRHGGMLYGMVTERDIRLNRN